MNDILQNPAAGDHFVQLYGDTEGLAEAVAEYLGAGLERGEAAIVIATAEHRLAFAERLNGADDSRLVYLDAQRTLEGLMANGMPQWEAFYRAIGGLIAGLRLRYPAVRAYGEMVDVLWQRGEREAAIRLEEYWNALGELRSFSLLCAYRMDPCDQGQYDGALQSVCKLHSHLIPARDTQRFDDAVHAASVKVLEQPLAGILLSLAARHESPTKMPPGQATLLWLQGNMPRTAEKVFSELRAASSPAG